MPEFMPYTTEKSMIFQVTESWANGDRGVALQAMWDLLDGERISDLAPIDSTNLDYRPGYTAQVRKDHVERDWWGRKPAIAPELWTDDQPPWNPLTNPTTGFWKHWYGDAEGVFRETMIRALAISLGVPREHPDDTEKYKGGPRPENMRGEGQHWPISILWKCPCPWYEGWIEFKSYRTAIPNDGHVTVVLSTPSHGVKLYTTPIRPENQPPVSTDPYHAYKLNPVEPAGPEGLWVVSQAAHWLVPDITKSISSPETWAPPTLGSPVVSVGEVVCVATSVGDGGAAPNGLPLTP